MDEMTNRSDCLRERMTLYGLGGVPTSTLNSERKSPSTYKAIAKLSPCMLIEENILTPVGTLGITDRYLSASGLWSGT